MMARSEEISGQPVGAWQRPAAVADLFYPGNPARLRAEVGSLLGAAPAAAHAVAPRALIVPHAGYVYSGSAAAAAYARLAARAARIRRVLLLGPPHRVAVSSLAVTSAAGFETPLGTVPIDTRAVSGLVREGVLAVSDAAHAEEHSLEVQLPFLQTVLDDFTLLPVLVGDVRPGVVAALLDPWWDADDALIVVSTDLSHFLDYAGARERDGATDAAIMRLDPPCIGPYEACGCRALNGLLHHARARAAQIERLALFNSGDSAGGRERVVGYAAYALG
ncbi:MAG: AmmeMemoRadiSam system protein B [Gammaproteobacteria bacterium]